jgi:putative sterol carrier protein
MRVALFPSGGWIDELVHRINGSSEYRQAADRWEGDISFVVGAEPDKGLAEDVWVWLDLWHGECRGGRIVSPDEGASARYIIRAPYTRWKDVVRGRLDPVKGMMQGKLKVQGDLSAIVRHVRAASELVHLTTTIPTQFIDDVGA